MSEKSAFEYDALKTENAALEARIEKLRAALEYYASFRNLIGSKWKREKGYEGPVYLQEIDNGYSARAALEADEEP